MAQDLKKQFSHREKISCTHGVVGVVDIEPENLSHKTPILLASGWGETLGSLEKTIFAIAYTGRRVIALDYSKLHYTNKDKPNGFPISSTAKANAIISVLKKKELKRVNIIAHSEGAINASIALHMAPEIFDRVILVAPGGVMLRDWFFGLAWRFFKNINTLSFKERKEEMMYIKEAVVFFLRNPLQATMDGMSVSRFKIHGLLNEAMRNDIKLCVIQSKDDVIFPTVDVTEFVKEVSVRSFRLVPGGHSKIHEDPIWFAGILDKALKELA